MDDCFSSPLAYPWPGYVSFGARSRLLSWIPLLLVLSSVHTIPSLELELSHPDFCHILCHKQDHFIHPFTDRIGSDLQLGASSVPPSFGECISDSTILQSFSMIGAVTSGCARVVCAPRRVDVVFLLQSVDCHESQEMALQFHFSFFFLHWDFFFLLVTHPSTNWAQCCLTSENNFLLVSPLRHGPKPFTINLLTNLL